MADNLDDALDIARQYRTEEPLIAKTIRDVGDRAIAKSRVLEPEAVLKR